MRGGEVLCFSLFPVGAAKRKNFAIRADAEKALAAGIASVGRKSQHALNASQRTVSNVAGGNPFQMIKPAARAVRVPDERSRYEPRVEARFARMAAPRAKLEHTVNVINDAASPRPCTLQAVALRTEH